MLATIIPYFLLAIVVDKSAWPNGPEIKFESKVGIQIRDLNDTNIDGLNMTNEFICRPKNDFFLQCKFQHKDSVGYETNTDTGVTKANNAPAGQIFEPFDFGIKFDKKGADKIIINETLSRYTTVLNIAKAMTSALNVATDINGLKTGDEKFEFGKVPNIYVKRCKGDVVANMQSSLEEDNSKGAEWNLELMPPLEKLAGRNLNIMKTWNMSDCDKDHKYFWLEELIGLESDEDSRNRVDVTTNLLEMNDKINISKENFDYMSAIHIKLNVNRKRTPSKEKNFDIKEWSTIRLSTVQPATDTWTDIENAVTLDLKEQE